jgi:hypothetical protein
VLFRPVTTYSGFGFSKYQLSAADSCTMAREDSRPQSSVWQIGNSAQLILTVVVSILVDAKK